MPSKLQKLKSVTHRIWIRLRTHGLVNTSRIGLLRIHEVFTDWRLGIDTRGRLQFTSPEREDVCVGYEASDYSLIVRALREVQPRSSDIVFLDYGCGKGRTIILAAMQPFRRVIGVDLDQSLLSTAESNLDRVRHRLRCQDVSLLNVDATQLEVPDDVNVIFMFNPFLGDVMSAVLSRIEDSLRRNERRLTVIFIYPPNHVPDPFAALPWFTEVKELTVGRHRVLRLMIYEASLDNVVPTSD